MVAVLLLGIFGCSRQKSQYEMLASRFNVAADKLESQRSKTLVALQAASETQVVAVMQEEFDFRSPETLYFVLQWEIASAEVFQLRRDVENLVTSSFELLGGLMTRAESINDEEIRQQTMNYVDERRREFEFAVGQTEEAIQSMENAMMLGNDIIESLRIVGTASLVKRKIGELEILQKEAILRFSDVDSIIKEGRKFLNIEFGQEIFI